MTKRKFSDIDWVGKLSSRKFWGYIIGLVTAIYLLVTADGEKLQLILGVITALADTAIYTLGEAVVDAADRKAKATIEVARLQLLPCLPKEDTEVAA